MVKSNAFTGGAIAGLTSTENIVMASGKGIDFSATPDGTGTTTSEVLTDYETGTWLPVFQGSTAGTATYTARYGSYTKIGNLVHVQGYINTLSLDTVAGTLRIEGLPFTSEAAASNFSSATFGYGTQLALTAGETLTGSINNSSNAIVLRVWGAANGTVNLTNTEWSADGAAVFSAEYIT